MVVFITLVYLDCESKNANSEDYLGRTIKEQVL